MERKQVTEKVKQGRIKGMQGEGMDFQMDEETHVDPLRTEECEAEWTDEEQKTLKKLKKIMDEPNRKRMPALKNVNKRKILSEVKKA